MKKEETAKQKTILNVGYCETTSEWLNRIITELADENKNFVDLSVICAYKALGVDLFESIKKAKLFVEKSLENSYKIGSGPGPLGHH